MITHSVEINRGPDEAFAYLDQLDRSVEWQESLISTRVETEGPTRVGSRGVDRRRGPGRPLDIPFEVTEHDPPASSLFGGEQVRCGRSPHSPWSPSVTDHAPA